MYFDLSSALNICCISGLQTCAMIRRDFCHVTVHGGSAGRSGPGDNDREKLHGGIKSEDRD